MQNDAVKVKQEDYSLLQDGISLVVVALAVAGIGGTIYKVISPEGWVAQAFGRSASAGAAALGSLLMIAALAWFSRGWSSPRERNRFSDLLMYGFAAAGLAYLAMFLSKGTF
jgi:drug/metabolite transporter (DMT)-like permease